MSLNPTYIHLLLLKVQNVFSDAYDKGDNDCLHEFLIPRAKRELSYIDDDGEAFENSSYYGVMEHIIFTALL